MTSPTVMTSVLCTLLEGDECWLIPCCVCAWDMCVWRADGKKANPAALRPIKLNIPAPGDGGGSSRSRSSVTSASTPLSVADIDIPECVYDPKDARLVQLRAIAPDVPLDILARVLLWRCNGDVEAAACKVFDCDVVAEENKRMEAERQRVQAAIQKKIDDERKSKVCANLWGGTWLAACDALRKHGVGICV